MNLKELAEKLSGCEYISDENIKIAKENGYVIVYGSSDDLIEFRGVIHDEGDCYDGGIVEFSKKAVVYNSAEIAEAVETLKEGGFDTSGIKKTINKIIAKWCPGLIRFEGKQIRDVSWSYETDIPHEKFKMLEDDDVYCIGIVFKHSDLK